VQYPANLWLSGQFSAKIRGKMVESEFIGFSPEK
jgi:hypothetical protein